MAQESSLSPGGPLAVPFVDRQVSRSLTVDLHSLEKCGIYVQMVTLFARCTARRDVDYGK